MTELVVLLAAITFLVVVYIAFQLLVWRRPAGGQVVIQTTPPQDPAAGCVTTLGTVVLVALVAVIAWLAMPDLVAIAEALIK